MPTTKRKKCDFHFGEDVTCNRPKGHEGACTSTAVWRIMLTNNEIILFKRAVQKALDNGWAPVGMDPMHPSVVDNLTAEGVSKSYIFDHGFAKALWPDDVDGNAYWRMHLQRMVVSENPIKYIGENYNDVN